MSFSFFWIKRQLDSLCPGDDCKKLLLWSETSRRQNCRAEQCLHMSPTWVNKGTMRNFLLDFHVHYMVRSSSSRGVAIPAISLPKTQHNYACNAYIVRVKKRFFLKGGFATNEYLTDFVLTVYTVIYSKTVPVLPTMREALAKKQRQSGFRQSDMNEFLGGMCPGNSVSKCYRKNSLPDCYFNRRQTSPSPAKPQWGRFSPRKIARRIAIACDFSSQEKIAMLFLGRRALFWRKLKGQHD